MSRIEVQIFNVGDRVVLRLDGADLWIDSKLQIRARKQIPGTVKVVIGTKVRASERSYRVIFDAASRMKSISDSIPARDLERAP